MSYRGKPKYASRDAHAGPWTMCSTCGFNWSQSDMEFQYDFMGGSVPQNTGWLRCPRCITPLTYQRKMIILPPDPPPFQNTRPEPYAIDETDWLTTEDGNILITESGNELITQIPNPQDVAFTTVLAAVLSYAGTLTEAYLDLFNGDPTAGGASILAFVTGSSTRTNVFSLLEADSADVLLNTSVITVSSASENATNVTHIGIYSAATSGTLLTSGPISATYPTIAQGAVIQFAPLTLSIAQS
jgi:hypothetical protein